MAVLRDRATGLLDMMIEGFRNQGQEVITPFNMSPVDRERTALQKAMNRPEVMLSRPSGQSMVTMQGGRTFDATSTPAVQAAVQSAAQPMSAQQLATARPRISPMQVAPAQFESNVEANRLIGGERAALGEGVMQPGMDREKMLRLGKVAQDALGTGDESIIGQVQDFFGGRENMLRLAMAFNTMRLQPDAQLTAALSKQLETVGISSRARQTAQALRKRGTPAAIRAAEYIENTGDVKGGMKVFQEAGKIIQVSGADLNEQEGTTAYDKDAIYNVNTITGQKSAIGGGGVSVNIGPEEGSLSTDYTFLRDADGNLVYRNGLPVAVPVPGSPAAQALQEAEAKQTGRKVQRERAGGTVIQDIQRGLDLIPTLSGPESLPGVAGANVRKIAEGIEGTVTNRISKFKESALSNVGLDTLQQMRENSPTGGALGQVPIQQQKRLEQVLGSLDVTQELDVLEQNMQRVINIYLDIVYGAKAERELLVRDGKLTAEENAEIDGFYYDLPFDPLGRPVEVEIPDKPDDIPQNVWDVMTDDEKRAF